LRRLIRCFCFLTNWAARVEFAIPGRIRAADLQRFQWLPLVMVCSLASR
jgi:hypothetical protein